MDSLTVTLNPAIDETIVLDALRPGHVHRATAVARHAGGKGVNVASCLADWGGTAVTATGFIGSDNARIFEALCVAKGIRDGFIRVPGETRTNIKLAHGGETTDINMPGQGVDAPALARLRAAVAAAAGPGRLMLLAGSLPPGVPETVYAELLGALAPTGARLLLDTSGAPLKAALGGNAMPACIKPNRAELEEFCGHALPGRDDLIGAARVLRARGIGLVVISLGSDGALFVGEQVLHAVLPAVRAASTVGAGDAMVAGMMAAMAEHADLETIARLATAFAAGKLGQAGPNLPGRDVISRLQQQVKIDILEETRK